MVLLKIIKNKKEVRQVGRVIALVNQKGGVGKTTTSIDVLPIKQLLKQILRT